MLTEFQERLAKYHYDKGDTTTRYDTYVARKTPWEPPLVCPPDSKEDTWELRTVQKCLALAMALEIPVGDRILSGLDRHLNLANIGYALLSNAKDEETHYEAFSIAHRDHKVADTNYDTCIKDLASIMPLVGDEIFQAGYLELSIFMTTLSMLRLFGSSAINTLVFDVSRDESAHVLTNVGLTQEYNLGSETPGLRNWRHTVIEWLTSDIPSNHKRGFDFWRSQSDHLYDKKQAPGLDFTKAALTQAFFESSASSRGGYTKRRKG